MEGTAAVTGTDFFRALVKHVCAALGVRYAFVAECLPNLRARSRAYWNGDDFGAAFEYALPGTPCMEVAQGRVCHVPDRLAERFPEDKAMIDLGTRSYLGVPLLDSARRIIGHLVIFHTEPLPADPLALSIMETFAGRAGAELERVRAYEELERMSSELGALRKIAELEKQLQDVNAALRESEKRFRDLFDEAPFAYVHEDLDSRFIRANKTALRILGIRPEEAVGTIGKTLVANTPDNQRRLKEAFDSIGRGTDTGGVILELRRKDNGKPVWIEWWSKPDPSGQYTRTMFLDITARVLMEQEKARLEAQNTYLQEEIRAEHNFTEIVGNSPRLRAVLQQVEQVAPADSTVLIFGETGTGKELIARAIHDRSPRRSRPLIKVNCGAISAGLVESELFGHVKGAFTGALANRDGRFKVADGGTIFLDEVGELPLDTQVKLLRVLQEQEFEPIGSSKTIRVNVRVIAATNRDLERAVREGKFRSDLIYRLNVFPITVPALRERSADIPLLVTFFLQRYARRLGRPVCRVAEETMRQLTSYAWPGNIRELQNVIERALILSDGVSLTLPGNFDAAPTGMTPQSPAAATEVRATTPAAAPAGGSSLVDVERRHIESVLAQTRWVIEGETGAARILNLQPSTLRSRMRRLGIVRPGR
jgi:PAS domain S-box-containing protein